MPTTLAPELDESLQALIAATARATDPLEQARTLLRRLLAEPDAIAALPLEWKPGALARNFLFGDETMSVWAMCWAPGAATSIHDHHCTCCFGMLSGVLTERWFQAVDDGRVVQSHEFLRGPNFMAGMVPTGPNIHQMANTGEVGAISIHIYGFDRTQRASSIEKEYQLAVQ
jgi:predicted metal-dependent enzyme (double-stranded beta helix superfamily)